MDTEKAVPPQNTSEVINSYVEKCMPDLRERIRAAKRKCKGELFYNEELLREDIWISRRDSKSDIMRGVVLKLNAEGHKAKCHTDECRVVVIEW